MDNPIFFKHQLFYKKIPTSTELGRKREGTKGALPPLAALDLQNSRLRCLGLRKSPIAHVT